MRDHDHRDGQRSVVVEVVDARGRPGAWISVEAYSDSFPYHPTRAPPTDAAGRVRFYPLDRGLRWNSVTVPIIGGDITAPVPPARERGDAPLRLRLPPIGTLHLEVAYARRHLRGRAFGPDGARITTGELRFQSVFDRRGIAKRGATRRVTARDDGRFLVAMEDRRRYRAMRIRWFDEGRLRAEAEIPFDAYELHRDLGDVRLSATRLLASGRVEPAEELRPLDGFYGMWVELHPAGGERDTRAEERADEEEIGFFSRPASLEPGERFGRYAAGRAIVPIVPRRITVSAPGHRLVELPVPTTTRVTLPHGIPVRLRIDFGVPPPPDAVGILITRSVPDTEYGRERRRTAAVAVGSPFLVDWTAEAPGTYRASIEFEDGWFGSSGEGTIAVADGPSHVRQEFRVRLPPPK